MNKPNKYDIEVEEGIHKNHIILPCFTEEEAIKEYEVMKGFLEETKDGGKLSLYQNELLKWSEEVK